MENIQFDDIEKLQGRVSDDFAVHVVGSDRPALLYRMILLFQPKRS